MDDPGTLGGSSVAAPTQQSGWGLGYDPTNTNLVPWRSTFADDWAKNNQTDSYGALYKKGGVVPVQGVWGTNAAQGQAAPKWGEPINAVGGFNTPGYQYGAPPAGDIQNSIMNNSGQFNTGYIDPAQMPVSSMDPSDPYVQKMQDAYYQQAQSRLDPQWQQTQADLESKLANMGLTRGSEAWNRELDNMTRGRNDAYNQAQMQSILTSGQEAARMQGMDINAGNFTNQAAQQNYQNQLASQQARNQALTGQQAADLAAGTFANQAQNQGETQAMNRASLNNAALAAQQNIQFQASGAARKANAAMAAAQGSANAGAYQSMLAAQTAAQNFGLQTRQLNDAEALQAFNMAQSAGMYPYQQQNAAMNGMYPTGMPNMPNYSNAGALNQPGYNQQYSGYNAGLGALGNLGAMYL
jgi:hypothetical protein